MKATSTFWFSVALVTVTVAGGVSNYLWYKKNKRNYEAAVFLHQMYQETAEQFATLHQTIALNQVQKELKDAENKIKTPKD